MVNANTCSTPFSSQHPLRWVKQQFANGLPSMGLEQRQAEARLLVEAAFNLGYTQLLQLPDSTFGATIYCSAWEQLQTMVAQRIECRMPIQYVLGEAWFLGRAFTVSKAVLIPRPETELLVEAALACFPLQPVTAPFYWADVGTGSGCIAISMALALQKQFPASTVYRGFATDISEEALAVAVQNAKRYGLDETAITVCLADVLNPVSASSSPLPQFHLIVSNPPYISPLLAPTLLPEVLKHEPTTALFSDDNGFALVRKLLQQAVRCLTPSGYLLLEVGSGMAATIANWQFTQTYFDVCRVWQDYAGHERFLTLRRKDDN